VFTELESANDGPGTRTPNPEPGTRNSELGTPNSTPSMTQLPTDADN
jgi:hypothetical protein